MGRALGILHAEEVCEHTRVGAEPASKPVWVSVGRACHSSAPTAPLGEGPGIAVVRTTFLKWVLMFFTAGKYAIMGIFPLQIPGLPYPPSHQLPLPHCSLYSLPTEAYFYPCTPPLPLKCAQNNQSPVSLSGLGPGKWDSFCGWVARSCVRDQPGRWHRHLCLCTSPSMNLPEVWEPGPTPPSLCATVSSSIK